jgi:hypothetical protein
MEDAIVRIATAREEYAAHVNEKTFRQLPPAGEQIGMTEFGNYLNIHPMDFVNGLFVALQASNWQIPTPPLPPSEEDKFAQLFQSEKKELMRTVIAGDSLAVTDPIFGLSDTFNLMHILYPLTHWKLKPRDVAGCSAISDFIATPANQHAYAGQKFDAIFTVTNKKYQLGLPLSFYDWQKWDLSTEHPVASDVLIDAVHMA